VIRFLLTVACLSRADDPATTTAPCVDEVENLALDLPQRLKAPLAIVASPILGLENDAVEHTDRVEEVDAMLDEIGFALRLIPFELDGPYVTLDMSRLYVRLSICHCEWLRLPGNVHFILDIPSASDIMPIVDLVSRPCDRHPMFSSALRSHRHPPHGRFRPRVPPWGDGVAALLVWGKRYSLFRRVATATTLPSACSLPVLYRRTKESFAGLRPRRRPLASRRRAGEGWPAPLAALYDSPTRHPASR
jgi:hypothetical protein